MLPLKSLALIAVECQDCHDNLQLKPGEYRVLVKGNEVAKGEMMLGYFMALDPGDLKRTLDGIPTKEPVFQLPALWVPEKRKEEAQVAGYTVVDISTIIATHLTEVMRSHADELLGRQDVQKLLDRLAQSSPKAVEELTPAVLPLGVVQKVLQNLLRERVSIRDLLTIVETLGDYGTTVKDPDVLTEYVRQKLSRSIVKQYENAEGVLPLITEAFRAEVRQPIRELAPSGGYGLSSGAGLTRYVELENFLAMREALLNTAHTRSDCNLAIL